LSAYASPERSQRKEVFALIKPGGSRAGFTRPQSRAFVGLVVLGIVVGIPIAVGIAPGSVFGIIGAMAACLAGRSLLAAGPSGPSARSIAWLTVFGWAMLAGAGRFGTADMQAAQAAQSSLGAAPLVAPDVAAGVSIAAGVAGLIAGVFWVESLPPIEGEPQASILDAAARWGETALAAAAIASLTWGPSFGGLVFGPLDVGSLSRTGISIAVLVGAVAIASALRRIARRTRGRTILVFLGILCLAANAASIWLMR
jgi:hypothetical protein